MVRFLKRLSLAGAAALVSSAAWAADLPAPVIEYAPEIPASGGWYLRGDIGYKFYGDPDGSFNDSVVGNLRYQRESMDDAWMVGVGVGYQFTDYFRSDITLDYETPSKTRGYAVCGTCGGGFSRESTDVDVWTVMLNGYVDIGTWNNITPYVGAGIGAAYVSTNNTISENPGGATSRYDGRHGEWNLAWALMAGASYAVTPNWSIDAGYQYRDLGTAKTVKYYNTGSGQTRSTFKDLTAHEIRLGVRYKFDSYAAAAPAPAYYPSSQPLTSNF